MTEVLPENLSKGMEKRLLSLYERKNRYQEGLCLCEGLRAVRELCKIRPDLILYIITNGTVNVSFVNGIRVFRAEERFFRKLSSTVTSQGILAVVKIPDRNEIDNIESPFVLVLDRIADPGNMGTIFRTALSSGLKEIWFSADSVDPFSEKTIRSALSAQFALKLFAYENINSLVKKLALKGFDKVFRTEPSEGESCFETKDLFDKSVIIFGNEANGIKDVTGSRAVNIPMPGKFESLNVAQAVTIVIFEAVRRKILR